MIRYLFLYGFCGAFFSSLLMSSQNGSDLSEHPPKSTLTYQSDNSRKRIRDDFSGFDESLIDDDDDDEGDKKIDDIFESLIVQVQSEYDNACVSQVDREAKETDTVCDPSHFMKFLAQVKVDMKLSIKEQCEDILKAYRLQMVKDFCKIMGISDHQFLKRMKSLEACYQGKVTCYEALNFCSFWDKWIVLEILKHFPSQSIGINFQQSLSIDCSENDVVATNHNHIFLGPNFFGTNYQKALVARINYLFALQKDISGGLLSEEQKELDELLNSQEVKVLKLFQTMYIHIGVAALKSKKDLFFLTVDSLQRELCSEFGQDKKDRINHFMQQAFLTYEYMNLVQAYVDTDDLAVRSCFKDVVQQNYNCLQHVAAQLHQEHSMYQQGELSRDHYLYQRPRLLKKVVDQYPGVPVGGLIGLIVRRHKSAIQKRNDIQQIIKKRDSQEQRPNKKQRVRK